MEKRTLKFYRKNESEVMKKLGLKPAKNSGAGWIEKEDAENDFVIAQLKSTDFNSIKFSLDDWHMLQYHANVCHKLPLFVVQFLKTGEHFLLVKPNDIKNISEYIEHGSCVIPQNDLLEVDDEQQEKPKMQKIIESGNREDFWEEKEKERKEYGKRSKT